MHKTKLYITIIITGTMLLISLVGCGGQKEMTKVSLATAKNMWCTLSLIADSQGFFKDEGLQVNMQYLQGGRYCLDALLSNSAEFANIVDPNVSYVAYAGETNVSVIGTIVTSTSSAIVARRSDGINSPEDIRGKSLGLSPAMTSDIFAHRFLEKYGIGMNEVDIRPIQPLGMQGAIVGNEIAAASVWEPFGYNIKKAIGDDAIEFKDPEIYTGYENIAVRKDWAKDNRETVLAFLRAIKRAEKYVAEHTADAQQAISTHINLDLGIVQGTWSDYKMQLVYSTQLPIDVERIGQWIHDTQEGYGDKPIPSYDGFFDGSFMQEIEK